MSVKLVINVPEVNQQIASGFDFIKVYRSSSGAGGQFVEVTSDSPKPAFIIGSVVGPFLANGMEVMLRINRGPTQTYSIIGEPLSATQLSGQLNANISGIVASDDGNGKLKISSNGTGTDEVVEFLGSSDLASILGFSVGQYDIGEATRIPLVDNIAEYLFEDVAGSESDYYQIELFNSSTLASGTRSDSVQGVLTETVAKQQADTRSPRGLTLLRKTSHVFREAFFQDPENCIPLEPLDASRYPSFQIVDINGQIVSGGLATQDGDPGHWRVEFFVPADALISNDDRRWRIEWLFIDSDNRQVEKVTEFDVRDVDVTASQIRDQKLMAMCGKPFRLYIRELKRPYKVSLDVTAAGNENCVVVNGASFPSNSCPDLMLTETPEGETYVYHYTVPESVLSIGTYQATWTIEQSVSSPPEYAFQIIEVPSPVVLQYFPSLRMVIDKYQKRREIIQSYQDSDIYEYLIRGLEFVNAWHPMTNFVPSNVPSPLTPYWLLAAQMWGLNAQHLLEVDLQFSFCLEENTLVKTPRGLVKAKDLSGCDVSALAAERLVRSEDIEVFSSILNAFPSGSCRAQVLVDLCNLPLTAQQLGLLFSKYNLNDLRSGDGCGGWLWEVGSFWSRLNDYGMCFRQPSWPVKFESKHQVSLLGQSKEPLHIWDLGVQDTYEVTTSLGYREVCTADHGFLTIDSKTLEMRWSRLRDLCEGDLVAMDQYPESDDHWDVFFESVDEIQTATTKQMYDFPDRLTSELARVLGYLVADGNETSYNRVLFGVSNPTLLDQFRSDFAAAFGKPPADIGYGLMTEGIFGYDPERSHTDVEYVEGKGAGLRRFLASIGLGYAKSPEKEIPWCVLQAPLTLVADFLQAYFDGDGCFGNNEVIFCSSSDALRSQLQALLLRFGIVSRNADCKVTVRGPSLKRYIDRIGFQHKRGDLSVSKFYPQREALPCALFEGIRNIRSLVPQVNSKGWYESVDGSKKRARLYWDHGDHYARYTTWDHVSQWWQDGREESLAELDPVLHDRIQFLLETGFLWQEISSITSVGKRRVLDPCLPEGDALLAHGFTAGGFVNHNSGQTVTLDYDHTGNLESAIQRAADWLEKGLTAVKTPLLRRSSAAGVMAGKPYRLTGLHNYTYRIGTYGSQDFLTLLSNFGLLAVPLLVSIPFVF